MDSMAISTPTQGASERIQRLVDELKRLPAQPNAAMRVLWALDDSSTSAGELARLVEADPALSARIMQLANTAQYGLFRRVSSAAHAIMVVGFVTVRALAVGSACGLFVDKKRSVPDGFWSHSAATAAAASVVAEFTGAAMCDAFSAGILHDIGIALLFREDPDDYDKVIELVEKDGADLEVTEEQFLGVNHTWVAKAVLEAWNFPQPFVEAISSHHLLPENVDPLSKAVIAGRSYANRLGYVMTYDEPTDDTVITQCTGLEGERIEEIGQRVQEQIDELAALFSW
jgi:putative nucleotidyltransferase with HDIG domain